MDGDLRIWLGKGKQCSACRGISVTRRFVSLQFARIKKLQTVAFVRPPSIRHQSFRGLYACRSVLRSRIVTFWRNMDLKLRSLRKSRIVTRAACKGNSKNKKVQYIQILKRLIFDTMKRRIRHLFQPYCSGSLHAHSTVSFNCCGL